MRYAVIARDGTDPEAKAIMVDSLGSSEATRACVSTLPQASFKSSTSAAKSVAR